MYHGMNPSNGDGFLEQQLQQQQPQSPQRLLAVILWFQLALCFGPAQLTGGECDRPSVMGEPWTVQQGGDPLLTGQDCTSCIHTDFRGARETEFLCPSLLQNPWSSRKILWNRCRFAHPPADQLGFSEGRTKSLVHYSHFGQERKKRDRRRRVKKEGKGAIFVDL